MHTGNLMKSLVTEGHAVTLATEEPIEAKAANWLDGVKVDVLPSGRTAGSQQEYDGNWAMRRLANYWGYQRSTSDWLENIARRKNADAIVAVGLSTLPCLDLAMPIKRIWYPADDPALHAYTLMRREGVKLRQIHRTTINIAYQRAFRSSVDAAWVVSSRDQKWMRRIGGFRCVDVIPNGVDANHYRPTGDSIEPHSCIFWGRLDFSPNVHALEYFLTAIWPNVRSEVPSAQFHVCGAYPTTALRCRLMDSKGVCFHENLDDLRPYIAASAVAVFPMVSGAGVKNKVLEAAAMAKPVFTSGICLGGLRREDPPPFQVLNKPHEWVSTLLSYWSDTSKSEQAGKAAREWVARYHSWDQSASAAVRSLERLSSQLQPIST